MLYGRYVESANLLVPAADSVAEFEAFEPSPDTYAALVEPDFMSILKNELFNRFRYPPRLYAFVDEASREAFVVANKISVVTHQRLVDLNAAMVAAEKERIESDDDRTIAEIHGLDKHDPWDERTEEEKERDEATEKLIEQAKKDGKLSGDDSFAAKKGIKIGNVTVNEVVKVGPGGGVSISVSARKTADEKKDDWKDLEGNPLKIEMIDMSVIYNRVTVDSYGTEDLEGLLGNVLFRQILRKDDTETGCWFDVLLQRHALEAVDALKANNISSSTVTVDALGEQMLPEGTVVVDEVKKRVIGPRPWKDQVEWDALTPEARDAEIKNIKPDEFLMCGYSRGLSGCRVYFVPREYWLKHEDFWRGEMHLKDILPDFFKDNSTENHPGRYDSMMNWNSTSLTLNGAGYREDMMFQIHVNGIKMFP